MVDIVHHRSTAPLRTVGSLTPMVGRAAARGDPVALSIVREAGRLMAVQTDALIRRHSFALDELDVTLCGGAWKVHRTMLDAYLDALTPRYPALTVSKPLFEPLICGPARLLLESGVSRREAIDLLKASFPGYVVRDPDAVV